MSSAEMQAANLQWSSYWQNYRTDVESKSNIIYMSLHENNLLYKQ